MCGDKKISLTILAENITSSRAFIKNIHTKKKKYAMDMARTTLCMGDKWKNKMRK